MKTLNIVAVRTIFSIERPIVVFEVAGHESIVRNPKQALIDLQNSGRALKVNASDLDRGVQNMSPQGRQDFVSALLDCIGAEVTGNISVTKAGDKYTPNDNHPMFTDKNHPKAGLIKQGESLIAEETSVWVEGFLSIPLTMQEKLIRESSQALANTMLQMFGFSGAQAIAQPQQTEMPFQVEGTVAPATAEEAFGTGKKK